MGVIQFSELEEMLAELPAGHTVRVAVLDITEGTSRKYGIRLAGIGVHVRAFDGDGHVLACYLPAARLQLVGDIPHPHHAQYDEYNAAWSKAEDLKDRIETYLDQRDFVVQPGVIDLGNTKILAGDWHAGCGDAPCPARG